MIINTFGNFNYLWKNKWIVKDRIGKRFFKAVHFFNKEKSKTEAFDHQK